MGTEVFAAQLEETGGHQCFCSEPWSCRYFVSAHTPISDGVLFYGEKMDLWRCILQDNKILLQPEFIWQHWIPYLYKCVQVPGHCPPSENDGKINCYPFCGYLNHGLAIGEHSKSSGHVLHQDIWKHHWEMLRYHP